MKPTATMVDRKMIQPSPLRFGTLRFMGWIVRSSEVSVCDRRLIPVDLFVRDSDSQR